jgi:hypothetical protein
MIQYSRTIRSSATGSAAAVAELIAGGVPCRLTEIGIIIVNATASTFALGRPAAIGLVPTTPVSLLPPVAGSPNSQAKLAVAWGTGPTLPAAFYRQVALPATAGASLNPRWVFSGGGIMIPAGGSIILWSITAVSIADIDFTITE